MTERLRAVAPIVLLGAAATVYAASRGWWSMTALGSIGAGGWLLVAIFDA